MIKEIERRLESGEDIVKLECVNKDGFLKDLLNSSSAWRDVILSLDHLSIESVSPCRKYVFFRNLGQLCIISSSLLKYFRIVDAKPTNIASHTHKGVTSGEETAQTDDNPTFNDLIDVAVKAYKDGVLKSLKLLDHGVHSLSYSVDADGDENTIFSQHEDYSDGINFTNSLYTETFVIEGSSCILKISENIQSLVLANGRDIVDGVYFEGGSVRLRDCFGNSISLTSLNILKGATVTQKRGK